VTEPNNFKFPALRSLGELADQAPVIIVDTREQSPLQFTRLESRVRTLHSGDYSILNCESLFAVERKSVPDLVGCCMGQNRERFERELHRLCGYRFRRLLVIGSDAEILQAKYHSRISPRSVLGSLYAFESRYDCPVVFSPTPQTAAHQIELWVYYFSREIVVNANNLFRASQNNLSNSHPSVGG
jgi:ERCC4-type nuclease